MYLSIFPPSLIVIEKLIRKSTNEIKRQLSDAIQHDDIVTHSTSNAIDPTYSQIGRWVGTSDIHILVISVVDSASRYSTIVSLALFIANFYPQHFDS